MISFTVYGTPAPKGSTRAFIPKGCNRPIITETNKHTRPWASLVKAAAIDALNGSISVPLAFGPVALSLWFYMPRPKSLPKKIVHHTKKPDLDKLIRCVKDSLTGVVWTDDSQVVKVDAWKGYVQGDMPRANVVVREYQ